MKTFLVSVTECYDKEKDINKRITYVVPAETKESALDQVMRNLTPSMLMDGTGYPDVMEVTAPTVVNTNDPLDRNKSVQKLQWEFSCLPKEFFKDCKITNLAEAVGK